ncbi:HAD family hydrolase [Candidatus Woesearchaeota archaeon]|nr:HAD family hydrolase [Candidatus Woesearchaeota archaeon]
MKNLWLFDIDGTLVDINRLHLESYKKIYLSNGIKVPDKVIISTFGMTEKELHKEIFKEIGLKYDSHLAEKMKKEHGNALFSSIREIRHIKPIKGVRELLDSMAKNKEFIGVVTGNIKENAMLILKKSRLAHFFSIIGYDDGGKSRKQIVKDTISRARKKFNFENVIVIGDTIYDIEAGKYAKAFTVGVATGSDSLGKLRNAKPDAALRRLTDYKKILRALRL